MKKGRAAHAFLESLCRGPIQNMRYHISTDLQMIAFLQPSGAVPGSCGYGAINETSWPFGAVASVTSNDSLVAGLPKSGCGTCFSLQCEDQVSCQSLL